MGSDRRGYRTDCAASGLEALEPRHLCSGDAVPFGADFRDGSEYMLGSAAVTVVLIESDGAIDADAETWTPDEIAHVRDAIGEGLAWWPAALERAFPGSGDDLRFVVDWAHLESPVASAYEPVQRRHTDEGLWIGSFLDSVGADRTTDLHTDMRRFNHAQRVAHGTNWAFTIFVVDSSADLDGRFADQHFAYAYHGGPYLVMTYDNGPWGAESMAQVTAHEAGHLFYALDEYEDGESHWMTAGYLGARNHNGARHHPNPDERVPSLFAEPSLQDQAFAEHVLSPSAMEIIGWRDADANGRFDLFDVVPALTGSGRFDLAERVYRFDGSSRVGAHENHNPRGRGRAMTIDAIDLVQHRTNGGSWIDVELTPNHVPEIHLSLPMPQAGVHRVEVRAVTTRGAVSAIHADVIDVPDAPPAEVRSAAVISGREVHRFVDADGTRGTVSLKGAGVAQIVVGDHGALSLSLRDTDARTTLRVNADAGGDGRIAIESLTIDGSLKAVDAADAALRGEMVVSGQLRQMTLGEVEGGVIEIRGVGAKRGLKLRLGQVADLVLDTRLAIDSLSVESWRDPDDAIDLVAPSVRRLKSAGPFEADIEVGDAAPGATFAAHLRGDLVDSHWSIQSAIGRVRVDGTIDRWRLSHERDVTSLRLADVLQAEVIGGGAGNVRADQWRSGRIVEPFVRSITIGGDFGADVDLLDAAARFGLGRMTVRGWLDRATVRSSAPVGAVRVGGMRHSAIIVGDGDRSSGLEDIGLAAHGSISRVTVGRGRGPETFVDSVIAAGKVGRVRLGAIGAGDGDRPFGIVSAEPVSVRRSDSASDAEFRVYLV
ncbi:MAG: hypothetical protein CMJ18_26015 [Phycisphaeraceae bacterium]|nr:hypothetical protein [Phycisphaeraceae bacterium]